ncbi:MAG: hypothetical protein Kow0025_11790 [Thermodesulfovibrionales bacterium]
MDAEVQATKSLSPAHKVTAGAAVSRKLKVIQGNYDEGFGTNLEDERRLTNWALYLQDDLSVSDAVSINAGVRYDHHQTFGGTTNPRIAVIYTPTEKAALKAVYGTAFRAPSPYELYYNDGGLSTKANPRLDHEEIQTYELIYEQYFGGRYRATAVGFHYDIDDLITQQTDPADGLLVFRNVDDVKADGVELELEGKSEGGMEGRVSYTFQKVVNKETGERLINSPRHLAKLNLILPLAANRVFLGIEEQYTARRRTLAGNYTDDFFITNATVFASNLLRGLELSASVYNLFDEKYFDPGGGEHVQDAIEQNGRTFRVKLSYIF